MLHLVRLSCVILCLLFFMCLATASEPEKDLYAELRLVGGSNPYEGRVEVKVGDNWGTICHISWDNKDAEVVCRQLGFKTNRALGLGSAMFGEGNGSIVMSHVSCSGNELSLASCNPIVYTGCDHSDDVSVICNWSAELRLVGGSGPDEGRVEVKVRDNWGTICDAWWDNKDAEVVCRQLGFTTNSSMGLGSASFGQGNGSIIMKYVRCRGTELSLDMCSSSAATYCDHSRDASVICNGPPQLRLVGGSGPDEGRVEIKVGDNWGTICHYGWDSKAAEVVCRQLGFTTNSSLGLGSATFGEGNGSIVMSFVRCNGDELSLDMCSFDTGTYCAHRQDVSVKCNWSAELRLVGGSGPHEGRIEVKWGENWGTIHANGWDNNDAAVVCRQLGFTTNGSVSFGSPIFGQGTGAIVMGYVRCEGTETSLDMCSYSAATFPDHDKDVSVICNWSAELRLVGGSGPHEGRVEVKWGDNWGTICHQLWDNKDTEVVCRQLGFTTNHYLGLSRARFGPGNGSIIMNFVNCNGNELSLDMCSYDAASYCDHNDDISVICGWSAELRLVGGSGPHEGRVEVKVGDNWGTICDNDWDNKDAKVVCRQLGFTANASVSLRRARFGQGNGSIVMDYVNCKGSEPSLEMCEFIAYSSCGHNRDASVICNWSAELRLVGGSGPHEGRVEVKVIGNWGTICDRSWDDKDTEVVCRQLGFTANRSLSLGYAGFGQGTGYGIMTRFHCTGTELSLEMCNHDTSLYCGHHTDVSIICNWSAEPRLVGGSGPHEGRVEVKVRGNWRTICGSGFDNKDAEVICRQLGFTANRSLSFGRANFGRGTGSIIMTRFHCTGTELSLEMCNHDTSVHCDHSTDVSIICNWSAELRLVGGSGQHEGRVEVKFRGNWGTICDNGWDNNDAEVVCRQLGFTTKGSLSLKSSSFGQGNGSVVMDYVSCNGNELSLEMCEFRAYSSCSHSTDASVICNWSAVLRLVGGSSPHGGRVEVKVTGNWRTICDASWDNKNAEVVCRQLGFIANRSLSLGRASFGRGNGSVIMTGFHCTGTELSLEMCNHNTSAYCDHSTDVSIICNWSAKLRLVDGSGPHDGRVEVKVGDNWGTICDNSWDDTDAEVVCRQLGFNTHGSLGIGSAKYGEGTGIVVMDNVKCKGTEPSLGMCSYDAALKCDHSKDVSVICNWSAELRLVGGSGPHEGRVEVQVGDNWGTICDNGWDDKDAQVVCRQLGFTSNGALSYGSAKFGQGTGLITMTYVNCKGTEPSLGVCQFSTTHTCHHGKDASVICTLLWWFVNS